MRAWLVVLVVLLAGCGTKSGDASAEPEEPLAHPDDFPDRPAPSEPQRPRPQDPEDEFESVVLGTTSGGVSLPGDRPFEITVPDPGVKEVVWSMFVEVGDSFTTYVTGQGCTAWLTSFTISTVVYVEGRCPDLKSGTYGLTVHLTHPVVSYSVVVTGERPLGNETADARQ